MNDQQFEKPKYKDGNIDGNKRINFDEKAFLRRERRLKLLFKNLQIPIRFIGDKNIPAMIIENNIVISAFVKNFDIIFTDKPSQGNHLLRVKLTQNNINDKDVLIQIYQALLVAEHRKTYRIQLNQTLNKMYLSGYNFLDKKMDYGRYPVFSQINPKVYFNKEVAEYTISQIQNNDKGDYSMSTCREEVCIEEYYEKFKVSNLYKEI
jgi:hypothetical protein